MNAKIGDCFLVRSGANKSGTGRQLAIVVKRTPKNAYCYKLSIRQGFKLVAENYKLDPSRIIKKVALDSCCVDSETSKWIGDLKILHKKLMSDPRVVE
jgi:hypothetical protein